MSASAYVWRDEAVGDGASFAGACQRRERARCSTRERAEYRVEGFAPLALN